MDRKPISTDSFTAWILAARPKTLTAAAVPVMIGGSLALFDITKTDVFAFRWWVFFLCFAFAFIMQIDANFINDYFDFKKGSDDEYRLGPKRACAMGWISERSMVKAVIMTTVLGCIVGLPLLWVGGWQMIIVGMTCVVFSFLYTTHLSYLGLGDILVLMFFGIVPVCFTYYLLISAITIEAILMSLASGFVIDTLLIVNNFRDREGDRVHGKRTLAVRFGASATLYMYYGLGLLGCLCGIVFLRNGMLFTCFIPFIYLIFHTSTFMKMKKIYKGKALNNVLGETARNIFLFGLLFVAGIICDMIIR